MTSLLLIWTSIPLSGTSNVLREVAKASLVSTLSGRSSRIRSRRNVTVLLSSEARRWKVPNKLRKLKPQKSSKSGSVALPPAR